MPDDEVTEERHPSPRPRRRSPRSPPTSRPASSGLKRRRLLLGLRRRRGRRPRRRPAVPDPLASAPARAVTSRSRPTPAGRKRRGHRGRRAGAARGPRRRRRAHRLARGPHRRRRRPDAADPHPPDPGAATCRGREGRLGGRRHRRLLEALHPRRLPGRALPGRARACCCARATSRPSTCSTGPSPSSARRPARCPSSRSTSTTRATSSPPATSPARSAPASGTGTADGRPDRRKPHRRLLTAPASPAGSTSASAAPSFARTALNKVFPDHWSFLLGELALYCFVVLLLTGIYLRSSSTPATNEVIYHGSYGPLRGVEMTEAYRSALDLSFDVRAGLVMRQIHHWAALLFLAVDRRAPGPGLLHRGVPPAPRAQLDHRRHAADPRPSSTASPATRCSTTSSRAPGCASPTRSPCRSRSSARGWPRCSSAASSPAPTSSAGSTSSTSC